MSERERANFKGRGSHLDLPNRFERVHRELDLEQVEGDEEYLESLGQRKTEYIADRSRSIVSENDSPDVGFRYSINPYRGCLHGCSYCFARPTHEYLGFNAGLDFESKILVKHEAPALFREFLQNPRWVPEPVALSGVTDSYQPAERRFRLSRGCLEVASEAWLPMMIVTKNALVSRDLDLLADMAGRRLIHVNVSVTTLDADLAVSMEPRTSIPAMRLRTIRALSEAGIPVRVLIAPVIPGLNDAEIPAILEACREAGAQDAGYVLLRLPLSVAPVFKEWLEREHPGKAGKVLDRLREARDGKLNNSQFGSRMRGTGPRVEQIAQMFRLFRRKHGMVGLPGLDASQFRAPRPVSGQLWLF